MLLGDNENFHGEEVVLFLQQLKGEVGGPWTIVWDRNQIHSKSRVVKAWWAKHPEVVVEDFPGHAPGHQSGRRGLVVDQVQPVVQLGSR